MSWGSTRPGELFTGCKRWRAEVTQDQFALWGDSQPKVSVHLIQLRTIRVTTGLMWATCHFDFQEGDSKISRSVDGIPNEAAGEMKRAVADATASALAALVSDNSRALERWLDAVMVRLTPAPNVIVGEGAIAKALSSVEAPRTPGKISWNSILGHEQAGAARAKAKTWPAWCDPPSVELERRLQTHNRAAFTVAVEQWVVTAIKSFDQSRWVPKAAASRLAAQYPAPEWPGKPWEQITRYRSPEAFLQKVIDDHNNEHLARQRASRKQFFDSVEKNPLTDEQIHACVCMDDNVLVVAAAGSGKTSTMVAKTGYALQEGLATPDQILLLAFNVATANEVGERIRERLVGVPDVEKVKSKTFHAFGIEVIATATGKKPGIAPWLENAGADIREIAGIIKSLSEQDAGFNRDWDLFRTTYARDIGKRGQRQEPEAYGDGRRGFLTARGEIVKSKEERVIADWLFYRGVNYAYERAYEHDTADQHHRQYYPDFYYPDADLYHEHFALNARGEAPREFKDYLAGLAWKRRIHAEKGTHCIETTSDGIYTGEAIETLERELLARGITLAFNPNREAIGLAPVSDHELARSLRVFQQHVKNNGLTQSQLRTALLTQSEEGYAARLRMFLGLYERISDEWERRLREGNCVDFEDMLIQAAEHVESGRYLSPYTMIFADEFQDSSRARIRLLKALTENPPTRAHLCVVGDDWQGINRFAGSDISVMTEFEATFEHATRLSLNTTFRCPQYLCDVSSKFIQANPRQIPKKVITTNPLRKTPLLAYGFDRSESIPVHIESQLEHMHRLAVEGKLVPAKGSHITVMLLGRYRSDEPAELEQWKRGFGDRLKVDYKTVHGSKGLEAEYVFVLNVIQDTRGFPSQIADDPALQMAMPAPDPYEFAEERRLFYVAMTRARKQVRFYTTLKQPSQFLVELVRNEHLMIEPVDGPPLETCPTCGRGVLQERAGKHGSFHGCSRFPACGFTRNAPDRDGAANGPMKDSSNRIRVPVKTGDQCPVCRHGVMQLRSGRNGAFLRCSSHPKCKATARFQSSAH